MHVHWEEPTSSYSLTACPNAVEARRSRSNIWAATLNGLDFLKFLLFHAFGKSRSTNPVIASALVTAMAALTFEAGGSNR